MPARTGAAAGSRSARRPSSGRRRRARSRPASSGTTSDPSARAPRERTSRYRPSRARTRPARASRARGRATRAAPFSPEVPHESTERCAALLVVAELVEARASGRKQHDVAGLGFAGGRADGGRKVAGPPVEAPGSAQCSGKVVARLADQVDRSDAWRQRLGELFERLTLQRSAEDEAQRLPCERLDPAARGAGVRRFRVVDEANAVDLGD